MKRSRQDSPADGDLQRPERRQEFEIAIICALPIELDAVESSFDHHWEERGAKYGKAPGDPNAYCVGAIGCHHVVALVLPGMGKGAAANASSSLRSSFPNIKLALVVGICGGVPRNAEGKDVLLGDVTISNSVVQIDLGRQLPNEFRRKDTTLDNLSRPSTEVRAQINKMKGLRTTHRLRNNAWNNLEELLQLRHYSRAQYPGLDADRLFESSYRHKHQPPSSCVICAKCLTEGDEVCEVALNSSCAELQCDESNVVRRDLLERKEELESSQQNSQLRFKPLVHFGTIASGDSVMKSGPHRDRIAKEEGVIAFEMEGAGVWDNFPCIIIKGVCDYSDSHKDKEWQLHATLTAAAYTKAVLEEWPVSAGTQTVEPSEWFLCHGFLKIVSWRRLTILCRIVKTQSRTESSFPSYIAGNIRKRSFSYMDSRQNNIAIAHHNTCDWLKEDPKFRRWLDPRRIADHNNVLWIKGKAGAGKSTLMKHSLSILKEIFNDHITAAYFFNARGGTTDEKTPLGMVKSLLYQLLDGSNAILEAFLPLFKSKKRKHGDSWTWDIGELQNFLHSLMRRDQGSKFLLLIDALDECNDKEVENVVKFLQLLSISAVKSGVCLRICLSSRHYPEIRMKTCIDFDLDSAKKHDDDIATYVNDNLDVDDTNLEGEILKKSSGVFMWVVLVVAMLNRLIGEGESRNLHEKLSSIPDELDSLFLDILTKGNPDKSATTLLLQWVLFAERSLSREELYLAVMAGTEHPLEAWDNSKTNDVMVDRYIRHVSRGLVEVITNHAFDETRVQFIHESVNDFLMRRKRLQLLDSSLTTHTVGVSQDRLAKCCFQYMHSINAKPNLQQCISEEAWQNLELKFPFLAYCARYAVLHAERAHVGNIPQEDLILELGGSSLYSVTAREAWTLGEILYEIQRRDVVVPEIPKTAALLYICSFGKSNSLLKLVLQHGADFANVNAQGGFYGNALQAAAYFRRMAVVELLLDHGAEVNAQGGRYGNALQAAASDRDVKVVELLLKHGAEVNAQGGYYGNALQAAAGFSNAEVVELLLEHRAEVNAQGGFYGNALQAAASDRDLKIVELLLKHGAEVNAQGGYHGNALQAAAYFNNAKAVELLLEHGAEANAQGGYHGNALQAAAHFGNVEAVELLLEHGAEVNAQGGYYGNALQAAVPAQRLKIFELLLEHGAEVNAQGGYYGNALQAATYFNNAKAVELLLKHGAEVNAQGGYYGNALQVAASDRDVKFFKLLLEHGAEVNAQGGYFGNALQAAAGFSNAEVVKLLLEHGAEVNAQGGHYGNALQAAAGFNNAEVVELLLEHGAEVNAQGGCYGNALAAAIENEAKEAEDFLRKAGAV